MLLASQVLLWISCILCPGYTLIAGDGFFLFCDLSLSLEPKLSQQPHCGKQLIAEELRRMETYPFSDNQKR